MGTRGYFGFVVNGEEKIMYNHSDSYPDGLGMDVLRWLRLVHLGGARRQAAELKVVSDNTPPTTEQIEKLQGYARLGVSGGLPQEWYVLLRETQGSPAAVLDAGYIEANPTLRGSMSIGYVVDFDANVFEAKNRNVIRQWPLDGLPADEEFLGELDKGDE